MFAYIRDIDAAARDQSISTINSHHFPMNVNIIGTWRVASLVPRARAILYILCAHQPEPITQ